MLAALLLALAPCALAQDSTSTAAEPGVLTGRATRVQAYKNGVALVTVALSGTADESGHLTYALPDAKLVLGGVWLSGDDAPSSVRARSQERIVQRPCRDTAEVLEANIGREVTVLWFPPSTGGAGAAGPSVLRGKALLVFGPDLDPRTYGYGSAPRLLALGMANDEVQVLPIAQIHSVTGKHLATTIDETEPGDWSLEVALTEPGADFSCELHFLARGIAWRAVYRLEGDLDGADALTVAAELSNDLMDLDGAHVDLVAGVPNFRYEDLASFLSLGGPIGGAPTDSNRWQQQLAVSNNMFSNNNAAPTRSEAPDPSIPGMSADGDLTRLVLGATTLERGGRSLVTMRVQEVPVAHVYTIDLDVRRGSLAGVEVADRHGAPDVFEPAYRGSYAAARRSKAWHRLALRNDSRLPWTSGPVLVVRETPEGPFPLAQEELRYTAAGSSTEVPMNLALGVETEFFEESLDGAGRADGISAVSGQLSVTNRIGEPIALRVRLGMGGSVRVVQGAAAVSHSPGRDEDWTGDERSNWRYHRESNPHAQVEWSIELAPGASAVLTYESEFDVRRR